ncbi:TP0183 family DNA metabolism protein [Treponema sp. OMZ 805]|uniref:TP0183 family DNA metabolism protein n=1 Tax=Treponema sp. OMZ 805 TaxID=2726068 RepID=UPI003D8DE56F
MKYRGTKKVYIALLLLLISLPQVVSALPGVAVYQLQAPTISEQTAQTVDNLVFSFIKELKTYTIFDLRKAPVPADFPNDTAIDYIFFGALEEVPEGIKLELILKGRTEQLTRIISKVYDNVNKILLDSRLLVFNLFDFSVPLEQLARSLPQTEQNTEFGYIETVDSLAGSWKGEPGLDRVMILRGGRGMAVFSSGVSVSLDLKIDNGYLLVTQKGSLQPRQFLNLPDEIARQAVQKTNPPQWRFLVSPDKKILSGTKVDAQIQYNETAIISVKYDTATVEWLRD